MAYEEALYSITLNADASIAKYTGVPGQPGSAVPNSGFQYRFVKITGKRTCGLATDASDVIVGVLNNKPQNVGNAATVGVWGISFLTIGAVVNPGDLLTTDNQGRGVKATVAGSEGAIALSASTVAGELIPVLLKL
jgi:hypothetical protein